MPRGAKFDISIWSAYWSAVTNRQIARLPIGALIEVQLRKPGAPKSLMVVEDYIYENNGDFVVAILGQAIPARLSVTPTKSMVPTIGVKQARGELRRPR